MQTVPSRLATRLLPPLVLLTTLLLGGTAHAVELKAGDILVADLTGSIIRVDPATGVQSVVSTGGGFLSPRDLTVDPFGRIFVTDDGCFLDSNGSVICNNFVIRVEPDTGLQIGLGPDFDSLFPDFFATRTRGIALAKNGDLFIADPDNSRIFRFDPVTGTTVLVFDAPVIPVAEPPIFGASIDLEASGEIIVCDQNTSTDGRGIYRPNGPTTTSTLSQGGDFSGLRHLAVETETCQDEESGQETGRCDDGTTPCTVATEAVDCSGQTPTDCSVPTSCSRTEPCSGDGEVCRAGSIVVADNLDRAVYRIYPGVCPEGAPSPFCFDSDDAGGNQEEVASGGDFDFPVGIAVVDSLAAQGQRDNGLATAATGDIWVSDVMANRIFRIPAGDDTPITVASGGELTLPWGIAIVSEVRDPAPLLAADPDNPKVFRVDRIAGSKTAIEGNGALTSPIRATTDRRSVMDPDGRRLVIDDNRLLRFQRDGTQDLLSEGYSNLVDAAVLPNDDIVALDAGEPNAAGDFIGQVLTVDPDTGVATPLTGLVFRNARALEIGANGMIAVIEQGDRSALAPAPALKEVHPSLGGVRLRTQNGFLVNVVDLAADTNGDYLVLDGGLADLPKTPSPAGCLDPNSQCSEENVPFDCCTGDGTGTCDFNAVCEAVGNPLPCCTGEGVGDCTEADFCSCVPTGPDDPVCCDPAVLDEDECCDINVENNQCDQEARVFRVLPSGFQTGLTIFATLENPTAIALDADRSVLLAEDPEDADPRISRVEVDTGDLEEIDAGDPADFASLSGLSLDTPVDPEGLDQDLDDVPDPEDVCGCRATAPGEDIDRNTNEDDFENFDFNELCTGQGNDPSCCTGPRMGSCTVADCESPRVPFPCCSGAGTGCDYDIPNLCDPDYNNDGIVGLPDLWLFSAAFLSEADQDPPETRDPNAFFDPNRYCNTGVDDCVDLGDPYECCTGANAGNCVGNTVCVGLDDPLDCCTGPGVGTCPPTPYACCEGLDDGSCATDEPDEACFGPNDPFTCCTGLGTGNCTATRGDDRNLLCEAPDDPVTCCTGFQEGDCGTVYVNLWCVGPNNPLACCTDAETGTCPPDQSASCVFGANDCLGDGDPDPCCTEAGEGIDCGDPDPCCTGLGTGKDCLTDPGACFGVDSGGVGYPDECCAGEFQGNCRYDPDIDANGDGFIGIPDLNFTFVPLFLEQPGPVGPEVQEFVCK